MYCNQWRFLAHNYFLFLGGRGRGPAYHLKRPVKIKCSRVFEVAEAPQEKKLLGLGCFHGDEPHVSIFHLQIIKCSYTIFSLLEIVFSNTHAKV